MKSFLIAAAAGVLILASQTSTRAQAETPLDQITAIVSHSACESAAWSHGQGLAPKAYIRGMALVFARSVCRSDQPDVKVVAAARGAPGSQAERTDALTWYDSKFTGAGLSNETDGLDTLRHAYVLMLALGMQETSGRYCLGRDMSADFTTADSAEAGLFQTSWGVHTSHPTLAELFKRYSADDKGCMLDVFKQHVTCGAGDAKNWGEEGSDGFKWQQLTKRCPAFAAEYAAVVLRMSGGKKGEFGPIRKKRAEVRPACDTMLSEVQAFVKSNPTVCPALQ